MTACVFFSFQLGLHASEAETTREIISRAGIEFQVSYYKIRRVEDSLKEISKNLSPNIQ